MLESDLANQSGFESFILFRLMSKTTKFWPLIKEFFSSIETNQNLYAYSYAG